MKTAAILVLVAGWAQAACIAVPSDRILARDLAAAVPLFGALDPETVIGYSPWPGTQRVLSARDLLLAARRYGMAFPPGDAAHDLCIERIVRSLSLDEVREALLAAFDREAREEISLEVIGFTNKPVPPGHLVFQLAALNQPPGNNAQTPVIWPGKLIYDEQNSLSVWARVRISAQREVFLAKEDIAKGEIIRAEQITATRQRQFPSLDRQRWSASQIVGTVARKAIQAGQKIEAAALENPKDVIRGDTVHVKVVEGAATVTLDGVAQSSGTTGDSILVHNPASGKSFRAVVEDRNHVIVIPIGEPAPPAAPGSSPRPSPGSSL